MNHYSGRDFQSIDAVTREESHHRDVDLRFARRSEGLFEVEGHLVDTKSRPFRRLLAKKDTLPAQHLHDITVHLVLDSELQVQATDTEMRATPFNICPGAAGALQSLVGLRIGEAWNKRVRELLGGVASRTHIMELLGPMDTTALQGFAPQWMAPVDDRCNEVQRQPRGGQLLRGLGRTGAGGTPARTRPAQDQGHLSDQRFCHFSGVRA